MKGIGVGCVPGVGRNRRPGDDDSCIYNKKEKMDYDGQVARFIPFLISLIV